MAVFSPALARGQQIIPDVECQPSKGTQTHSSTVEEGVHYLNLALKASTYCTAKLYKATVELYMRFEVIDSILSTDLVNTTSPTSSHTVAMYTRPGFANAASGHTRYTNCIHNRNYFMRTETFYRYKHYGSSTWVDSHLISYFGSIDSGKFLLC